MPRPVISFAESALRDLEEVRAWYAEQGVSEVGARPVAEVFQRVQAVADHTDMGRVVPEFDQPFLRERINPPFRIVYRRDPQQVRIVRVWRSERLLHLPTGDEQAP
ncbi:type II toxin-antitoxin system RelE/ParE family toxin [Sedimenticola selenatireducens]|uniref:Addiction module toxin RelE n=1 Tax=Sedimenticola selenatireducens TaxID=191960 RepID=A0A2N6CW48_9GAMM|nr:type II toxin-antitoxin system RelE/ParE family toxin [Sedimenticola selenatireducens]PLX61444.1 MAG: addiction module toxin RelE [Sedimenticola selenatireducens]